MVKNILKFNIREGKLCHNLIACEDGDIPYEVLRDNVEGIIEYVYYVDLGLEGLALVVNGEGLIHGLEPTFWLYDEERGDIQKTPLVGNILVVKVSEGNTLGLTKDEIEEVLREILVYDNRYYLLKLNNRYIKESNKFLSEFLSDLNSI